jgi:hypothetical protein
VKQEAAQELLRIERHPSLLIPVGIILPAKGNPVPVEGSEAVVGDGHAMGVAEGPSHFFLSLRERDDVEAGDFESIERIGDRAQMLG